MPYKEGSPAHKIYLRHMEQGKKEREHRQELYKKKRGSIALQPKKRSALSRIFRRNEDMIDRFDLLLLEKLKEKVKIEKTGEHAKSKVEEALEQWEEEQLEIAKQTLDMGKSMAMALGGMTPEEAEEIVKKYSKEAKPKVKKEWSETQKKTVELPVAEAIEKYINEMGDEINIEGFTITKKFLKQAKKKTKGNENAFMVKMGQKLGKISGSDKNMLLAAFKEI
jgi:predicted DNA-binding protein